MAAAPGGASVPDDIKKGIQKVGGTEFNVDRGVVDKILENQAELTRQARIVPEQENGKVVGIRLFGVRQNTPPGALGMENGDRLEKINGFDMTSPEKALEASARLRTSDYLTVSVNRRGSRPTSTTTSSELRHARIEPDGQPHADPAHPRHRRRDGRRVRDYREPSHSGGVCDGQSRGQPQGRIGRGRRRLGDRNRKTPRRGKAGRGDRGESREIDEWRRGHEDETNVLTTLLIPGVALVAAGPTRAHSPKGRAFGQMPVAQPTVTQAAPAQTGVGCHETGGRSKRQRDRATPKGSRNSRAGLSMPRAPAKSASDSARGCRPGRTRAGHRRAHGQAIHLRRQSAQHQGHRLFAAEGDRRRGLSGVLFILEANGLTVGPTDGSTRLSSRRTPRWARRCTSPVKRERTKYYRDITRIHRLRHVSADEVANVLGHFKSKDGDITVYGTETFSPSRTPEPTSSA